MAEKRSPFFELPQEEVMNRFAHGWMARWHTQNGATVSLAYVNEEWVVLSNDFTVPVFEHNFLGLFVVLAELTPRMLSTGFDIEFFSMEE